MSQSVDSILFPDRKAHIHSFLQRVEYSPSRVAVRLFTLFSILFEQLLPVVPPSAELAEAVVSNVCRLKLYIYLSECVFFPSGDRHSRPCCQNRLISLHNPIIHVDLFRFSFVLKIKISLRRETSLRFCVQNAFKSRRYSSLP